MRVHLLRTTGSLGLFALAAMGCSERALEPGRFSATDTEVATTRSALLAADFQTGLRIFEPHLAVNPNDRRQLAVGALNSGCDVQVSMTGPGGFGPLIDIPRTPTEGCASDPSLAFDSNGRLFASFLGPTETGVAGPAVVIQQIDVPTATPVDTAGVPCSSVGAQVADCPIDITMRLGLPPGSGVDKQWIAIDTNPTSPFRDRIYAIWIQFGNTVLTAYSADRGATWTKQVLASTSPQTPAVPNDGFTWPFTIEVAANGDVYAAYHAQQTFLDAPDARVPDHSGYIAVYRSTTGGTFDLASRLTFPAGSTSNAQMCVCTPAQIADGSCQNSGGVSPPSTPCPRRLNGVFATTVGIHQPYIVPDPLNPAHLVVVYADDPTLADGGLNDDADVRIARSTDFGQTWTLATVPAQGAGPLQLFPNAAGLPGSRCLTVSYYNTNNALTGVRGGNLLDVYAIVSPDLGQTWLPEVRLNDTAFDPGLFGGDYLGPNPLPDPSTWIPTPRMGEYFGLVHAAGAAWTGHDTDANRVFADYSDGLPPTVTPPPPVTVNSCRPAAASLGNATASDECGMPPLSAATPNNLVLGLGVNTVTWTATDGANNVGTATQTVTVTDTTGPSFTVIPADITTTSCTGVNIGSAFAQDDCGGNVTITNNAPAQFPLGTTTVTWTAVDARGNSRTATQRVTALLGDNPSCCPPGTNIILGTSNNNTLNGTANADCILGRGAQDTINGNGGNDFISGGDGDDNINGGSGNDSIFGGSGQDTIIGGIGNDTINGGDGDDHVFGGAGNDIIRGGQGQDDLQGEDNDDIISGDVGDDTLSGGNGNDTLVGGPHGPNVDTCTGGAGTNVFESCELGGGANACADGVQNGTQTGIDCGGGCLACATGGGCLSGNDCLGGVCSAGICQALPGGIKVVPFVNSDWGGGYCVALLVTNANATPTVNWNASLNTNQSTIYTSWNATFTGTSGAISVSPNLASNQVIDPAETDGSIGFCANRNVPGGGQLPFVTGATGAF